MRKVLIIALGLAILGAVAVQPASAAVRKTCHDVCVLWVYDKLTKTYSCKHNYNQQVCTNTQESLSQSPGPVQTIQQRKNQRAN